MPPPTKKQQQIVSLSSFWTAIFQIIKTLALIIGIQHSLTNNTYD